MQTNKQVTPSKKCWSLSILLLSLMRGNSYDCREGKFSARVISNRKHRGSLDNLEVKGSELAILPLEISERQGQAHVQAMRPSKTEASR